MKILHYIEFTSSDSARLTSQASNRARLKRKGSQDLVVAVERKENQLMFFWRYDALVSCERSIMRPT